MSEQIEETGIVCPYCGESIGTVRMRLHASRFKCPKCGQVIKLTEIPAEMRKFIIRERGEEEETEIKPRTIFPEPREPSEIISEILRSYGLSDEFIDWVARYVDRKGGLDPGWLLNILTTARTGRKLTAAEAYMIVDEVISELEKERQEAERLNRPWTFQVISFYRQPEQLTSSYFPTYTVSSQPLTPFTPSYQYRTTYTQPYAPLPPQLPSPPLTEEKIRTMMMEMLQRALEEKKKDEELKELRREVQKTKEETDKKIMDLIGKVSEMIDSLKNEISLKSVPQQQPEQITKKDLELIKKDFEAVLMKREYENLIEKLSRGLETVNKELEKVKEEASKPKYTPLPSEGYQTDQYRLVADTIKTLVRPGEWYPGRAVSEVIVKLVPSQQPPPERKEIGKVTSIIEELEKIGGIVE